MSTITVLVGTKVLRTHRAVLGKWGSLVGSGRASRKPRHRTSLYGGVCYLLYIDILFVVCWQSSSLWYRDLALTHPLPPLPDWKHGMSCCP